MKHDALPVRKAETRCSRGLRAARGGLRPGAARVRRGPSAGLTQTGGQCGSPARAHPPKLAGEDLLAQQHPDLIDDTALTADDSRERSSSSVGTYQAA